MPAPEVIIQPDPFDYGAQSAEFARIAGAAGNGAVVTFLGLVRDNDGRLGALEIEHYPAMTRSAIAAMADEAARRWPVGQIRIIHRHGLLAAGAPIMMVATAARHREAAFLAAEFLMDYLKSRAPFWKKEIGPDGAHWVEAEERDEAALKRW